MESQYQIQLTAILDGLMKSAVSDICALTDSWVQSLQMEIMRSQRENQDLKQKIYSMEQQPPAQTQPEEKSETEEAPINNELNHDSTKTSGNSGTESAGFKRGQWCVIIQKWSPALGGSREVVDRSISQKEKELDCNPRKDDSLPTPTCEDTEASHPLYELKTELEKPVPELQKPEHSPDGTAGHEDMHEDPTMWDQNNDTKSHEHFPQPKTEEEDEFDVTGLLIPDLQPTSTHLHTENQSQSASSDSNCSVALNVESNLNVSVTVPNATRFSERSSVPVEREKHIMGRLGRFICDICGKTLTTKRSLFCHMRLHSGERPFTCTQCGKGFAKKFNLEIHYNVHSGARPYACPLCPRSFADPSAFGRHKILHRKKLQQDTYSPRFTFVCSICGQSFPSRPSLSAHFKLHAAEKKHSTQKLLQRNVH